MSYPPPPVPAPAPVAAPAYASWFSRVGSFLIDVLCSWIAGIPAAIGAVLFFAGADTVTHEDADGMTVIDEFTMTNAAWAGAVIAILGVVFMIGFQIWNLCVRQSRTGSSLGKSAMGTVLIRSADGQHLGVGMCFLRQILHFLDSLVCYLGYLWPIWDNQRQTFATSSSARSW